MSVKSWTILSIQLLCLNFDPRPLQYRCTAQPTSELWAWYHRKWRSNKCLNFGERCTDLTEHRSYARNLLNYSLKKIQVWTVEHCTGVADVLGSNLPDVHLHVYLYIYISVIAQFGFCCFQPCAIVVLVISSPSNYSHQKGHSAVVSHLLR